MIFPLLGHSEEQQVMDWSSRSRLPRFPEGGFKLGKYFFLSFRTINQASDDAIKNDFTVMTLAIRTY